MRVIAGRLKGRTLKSPPRGVRPTTDRLRESLFNYLGQAVKGSVWLDLFGGSGAVAIEALSRGAQLAVINERDPQARRVIIQNLTRCQLGESARVYPLDAFALLRQGLDWKVDYLFLDPPYGFRRYGALLEGIAKSGILSPNGTVLLEVFKKTPLDFLQGWQQIRCLKAGDSHLLVLQVQPAQTEPGSPKH